MITEPIKRVVLDNPPERLMTVEWDGRKHDPYNSADDLQEWPRPKGECEFIREQHPWLGQYAR